MCMLRFADDLNCGPQLCRENALRCSEDKDCKAAGNVCIKDASGRGECTARTCKLESECKDPNLICTSNVCYPRACKKDSECKGFCLSGYCAN